MESLAAGGPRLSSLRAENARVRVLVQFVACGEHADRVRGWLADHYPHVRSTVAARPGLAVTLTLPSDDLDDHEGWHSWLMEPVLAIDLALEIIEQCLIELGADPCRVLGMTVGWDNPP